MENPEEQQQNQASIPYNKDIAHLVEARIKKQLKGNRINPASVKLVQCKGEVFEFYAATHIALHTDAQESTVAGRASGGEIVSQGQARNHAQDYIQSLGAPGGLSSSLYQQITGQQSRGFGLHKQTIPVQQEKSFIEHHNCTQCGGKGAAPCSQCGGQAQMTCYKCSGRGQAQCAMCRGTRVTHVNGQEQQCHHCYGRGMSACDVCRGGGFIACTSCAGKGQIACTPCGSVGISSHIYTVKPILYANFELRDDTLPQAAQNALREIGADRLAEDGSLQATPLEQNEEEATKTGIAPSGNDFIYIPYRALLPYAQAEYSLGKGRIKGEIIGYKGLAQNFTNFMDKIFQKPHKALKEAAAGRGDVASRILYAAQWRSVKQALIYVVKGQERKAVQRILKENPIGLSKKCAQSIIRNCNIGLKKITRKPRYIALSVSLLLNAALMRVWFDAAPLKDSISQQFAGNIWIGMAGDLAIIPLLTLSTIFIVRVFAHHSLNKSLGSLGLEQQAKTWPKAGTAALYAWLLNPFIFFIVIMTLTSAKPGWFVSLIGS